MSNEPQINCTSELYIEADSKLSAMETFLDELRNDTRAWSVLLSMVRKLEAIVEAGLEVVDVRHLDDESLRRDVNRLREAIAALPEDRKPDAAAWNRVRGRHRECRESFSELMDALLDGAQHRQSRLYTPAGRRFDASA